jgi:FkbM family methyltransferase
VTVPADRITPEGTSSLQHAEDRIRLLHELRHEARLRAGFETQYVGFVRSLRERLHPRGVRDIRTVAMPGGLRFQVDLGDRLGCDIFYGHFDERFEADLFVGLLRPGATMIDVGANFGYYALRCAQAIGPGGTVHAFEPDPSAFGLLCANVAANGLGDTLRTHAVAVAERDCDMPFHLAEEAAFSGLSSTGRSPLRGVVNVTARSLDAFAAERGIEQIDALKIDVEGHEAEVLRGGHGLLCRATDPLIMLEVSAKNLTSDGRSALTAALDGLFANGYRGRLADLSMPGGLRDIDSPEQATTLAAANLLLVRPGRALERRLREAVTLRIGEGDLTLRAEPVDRDGREIRLFRGLDPDLVSAALRDKAAAENRVAALTGEVHALRGEIAALRTEVRRLRRSPVGLALSAIRRVAVSAGLRRRSTL